jgi:1-acyl-sn-glycerol-3-phosphate acyltransferase
MTVLRRFVTVPLVTALMVCLLVFGPLLLAVTGLAGLAAQSSRPVRTVALAMAYAFIELRTLVKLACGNRDCDRLMEDVLTTAYTAVRRILDVEVVLDPSSTTPEELPHHEPVIVLSRHCGPGDSLLVAWLLTIEYRLQVRIVLKAILRCEPVLDFAGELGCLCFLAGGGRARHQIHELAASLAGGQALLLFPEGANFTWPRWRAAVAELRSTGRIRAASRALRQSHTLPLHTAGATAAVTGAPSANVLVLTHNGFCPDGRARPWWQLPIHRQLLVRTALFPAADLPQPDQLSPWLERTWTQVDAWVAGHTDPG